MKIICVSDTHTKHKEIPLDYLKDADLIIHAGDICNRGYKYEVKNFLDWFSSLPIKNKVFIGGNHDFYLEKGTKEDIELLLSEYPYIIYLNDSGVEIDGFKIWGSPVQPWFYDWAFNRKGADICKHWDLIPLDVDILITHGPIKGYLDLTMGGESVGCPHLLDKIKELKNLRLHVAGHIHEAYGIYEFESGQSFVNASVLNLRYEMQNRPISIELIK
jgi:hypothetical protein